MLGLINDGMRGFIIDTYGADAWAAVAEAAGIDKTYVTACPYPDEVTYKALSTLAEHRGLDFQNVLEDCGYHFCMTYVPKMGFEPMLRCMGGSIIEFLQNLNIYHLHLSMSFKEMDPPAFNVDDVTPESVVFHYTSTRPGLTRFAMGLLRGAAKLLYDIDVEITVLQMRGEVGSGGGDGDEDEAGVCEGGGDRGGGGGGGGGTDTLLVRFPPQDSVMQMNSAAATCRLALDPTTFFKLFPFHMVIDAEGRLVQVGRALSRMYPAMKPDRLLTDFFTLRHPYIPCTFERMMDHPDNIFVFRSKINGMELKGQMQFMQMPAGNALDSRPGGFPELSRLQTSSGILHDDVAPAAAAHAPSAAAAAAAAAVAALGAVAEEAGSYRSSLDFPDANEAAVEGVRRAGELQERVGSVTNLVPELDRPAWASRPSSFTHPTAPTRSGLRPGDNHNGLNGLNGFNGLNTAAAAAAAAGGCPHLAAALSASGTSTTAAAGRGGTGGAAAVLAALGAAAAAAAGGSGGSRPPASHRTSSTSGGCAWNSIRHYQRMHPGGDVESVLVFLGSPRIGNVEELRTYGLYVSDLPLFDHSREMVLLAEQRTAEAALKDTFERLSLQLEEERQRSEQLLHQMIPRHIADALRRGERVNAEIYPEATILFSDVVNFTTIAAGSTAMEVCTMLDSLYNEFDELIDKYPSLYKVETIGDAYMLVANVTEPCPDHVDVVLDFALDMQRVCARVTTNMGAPIQIRVGIHTGSVVGGVVGRKMPRFHLFGDTVNTASRMESHGLAGAVHISAASRALITNPAKYLITERGEIAVKGKGLMETFLVSRADAPTVAHLRCILAATTAPEYAAQVVPVVHPAAAQPCLISGSGASVLGRVGLDSTASLLLQLQLSSQQQPPPPPTTASDHMSSTTSTPFLSTAQLQALIATSGGGGGGGDGDGAVRASISCNINAAAATISASGWGAGGGGAGGGEPLDAAVATTDLEGILGHGTAASLPYLHMDGSQDLDLEFAMRRDTAAPVVPGGSPVRLPRSQLQPSAAAPAAATTATESLRTALLQRQQQQMESLELYSCFHTPAVQVAPEQVMLLHSHSHRAAMVRSYSSVDVCDKTNAAAAAVVATTGRAGGICRSAAAGSPLAGSAGGGGCFGGGATLPPSSPCTSGVGGGGGGSVSGGSGSGAQATRRRVLLAARRPRRPSFYLRVPSGTPSVPQLELPELEVLLQRHATEREVRTAAENTVSGNPSPPPHPSPPYMSYMKQQGSPSQLSQLQQDDSSSGLLDEELSLSLRRLVPVQKLPEAQDRMPPQLNVRRSPEDSAVEVQSHTDAVQLQLRQRSFLADATLVRSQQQQLQQLQPNANPGTAHPPLPVMSSETILVPYEDDEFTGLRHRLTRNQEDYGASGNIWF